MTQKKDQQATKTIHDAVKENNIKELESIVARGASVNEVDPKSTDKFTPLHWAAYFGNLESIHWLLWQSADMDAQTPKGWTPAHIAAIRGHENCLQAFLNNNVNLNKRDRRNQTCLHLACSHGNSFVVQVLLRAGIDIHLQDCQGWTAAFTAAFHGRLGCLQMLVKWGAKLDETDNEGNTAAHLASMEGHLPCLKYIISSSRDIESLLGARNDQGDTAKSLSEQFYKEDCCTYLDALEWEKTHPEQAENLAFPAHVAAFNGDFEHVKLLVEQGVVDVNERDERGATMAHKAAGQGHIEILRWLIEMGASTDLTTISGETPKDVARRFARLDSLKILGGSGNEQSQSSSQNIPNDQNQRKIFSNEEQKSRAKQKYEDLLKQIEIAKKNYQQLGGFLDEDFQRQTVEKENQKKVDELQQQLDFDRLRREKLEAELDECRNEIVRLINTLRNFEERKNLAPNRPTTISRHPKPRKSSSSAGKRSNQRTEKETGLIFRRLNSQTN